MRCVLSPPRFQPLGFLGAQQERHLRCAVYLLWEANLWLQTSWQMSIVQDLRKTWLATGSLLTVWWWMRLWSRDCLSPSGSGCRPPASLPLVGGWVSSQLAGSTLVFSQSFVLWVARQCLRAFCGKILSQSLSLFFSQAIPQFGLLSQVSSLRLSSGHSGPVLTLSMQPRPPCSAPARCWWPQVSGLLLLWELQLDA